MFPLSLITNTCTELFNFCPTPRWGGGHFRLQDAKKQRNRVGTEEERGGRTSEGEEHWHMEPSPFEWGCSIAILTIKLGMLGVLTLASINGRKIAAFSNRDVRITSFAASVSQRNRKIIAERNRSVGAWNRDCSVSPASRLQLSRDTEGFDPSFPNRWGLWQHSWLCPFFLQRQSSIKANTAVGLCSSAQGVLLVVYALDSPGSLQNSIH